MYLDHARESRNDKLTPGGVGELRGKLLKVDPEAAKQGVYFLGDDGGEVKSPLVIRNKPSNLLFEVPESLAIGDYTLEIRSIVKRTSSIRTGQLGDSLTVE